MGSARTMSTDIDPSVIIQSLKDENVRLQKEVRSLEDENTRNLDLLRNNRDAMKDVEFLRTDYEEMQEYLIRHHSDCGPVPYSASR